MKALYIILWVLFPLFSFAQTTPYRSYFGKEFTHWYVVNERLDADRWSERYSTYNQDTLLNNGIYYQKVYLAFSLLNNPVNSYYSFGIREDIETGSLFVALDSIYEAFYGILEVLISKMDLEIGDKYYFPPIRTDFNQPDCRHCFQDVKKDEKGYFATVDSIYYKDNRKHIRLDANYIAFSNRIGPLTFIEGIGPNVSFVPLISESSKAVCCNCYEDETGVWKSDIKDEYIDFSQADCFFEITGIPQIQTDFPLKLIQRKGEIELRPDAAGFESGKVYVYSMDGKFIYTKSAQADTKILISTSGYSKGAYIIRLTDEKAKKNWSGKVII